MCICSLRHTVNLCPIVFAVCCISNVACIWTDPVTLLVHPSIQQSRQRRAQNSRVAFPVVGRFTARFQAAGLPALVVVVPRTARWILRRLLLATSQVDSHFSTSWRPNLHDGELLNANKSICITPDSQMWGAFQMLQFFVRCHALCWNYGIMCW